MFCSPTLEARHYWTWAWQMAHLEIGVLNFIVSRLSSIVSLGKTNSRTGAVSPVAFLAAFCAISSGVWIYTLLSAPYSISEIFALERVVHSDFISHTRWALKADEVFAFASAFLWLSYSLLDLGVAGIEGRKIIIPVVLFPIVVACLGPGSAFALGWYWRETLIQAGKAKGSE